MKIRIGGREDVLHVVWYERAIPRGLEESCVGLMYFFHGIDTANIHSIRTSSNDWTLIFHMSIHDVPKLGKN